MITRKKIQEGEVFSIKIQDDLFTLCQIRFNHRLEVFNITNNTDEWKNIDLNNIPILFCIVVAEDRLVKLFYSNQTKNVIKNEREVERKVISFAGRDYPALVEMDKTYEAWCGKVLIDHLTIEKHLDIIHSYELPSMEGNVKKIHGRILRYYTTGINWEDSKKFIFSGVIPPSPDSI